MFGWFRKAAADVAGVYINQWQSGKPYVPITNPTAAELVKRYSGWVYAAANKNASTAAQVPLRLYAGKPSEQKKANFPIREVTPERLDYLSKSISTYRHYNKAAAGVVEVVDHPIIDLLTTVNPVQNGFDLYESLHLFCELAGNAYWLIVRDEKKMPFEIWPLMPQYTKPIVDSKNLISGYEFKKNDKKITYPVTDVVHFRYTNPKDPVIGMGKLEAAIISADLSTSMGTYETTLFENSGRPDMALTLPADAATPSSEELARLKREWKRRHGGKGQGGLAILSGGADLKPMTLSPKDMNFLNGRKATLSEIAGIFGVPLSKLTVENVNRANAEAGNYSYMKDTIEPMLIRTEQKMNEQFIPMWDSNLFVAFDNAVPEDKEFRLKERTENIKIKYTSINEERGKDGLEPALWGENPKEEIQPAIEEQSPNEQSKITTKNLEPLRVPSAISNPAYIKALEAYYNEVRQDVLLKAEEDLTSMDLKNKGIAHDFASGWFDMQKWNEKLSKISKPFLRSTMIQGGRRAMEQVKPTFQFEPIAANVEDVMLKRTGRIVDLNKRYAADLRKTIEKVTVEGTNVGSLKNEIKRQIQDDLGELYARNKARVIARTEINWAFNEGALEGYKQSRVVEAKEWLVSGDDRLCEWCEPMDGVIVGLSEPYFEKGDTLIGDAGGLLSFDYETVEHPPLHPMCRCTLIPVLKEI